jgi:hypothetical protein
MLSTEYRLKLENICNRIAKGETVELNEVIWAEKLASRNSTASKFLRQARRIAATPDMKSGSLDDFLNVLDLGKCDPSDHVTSFDSPEDIANFFHNDDDMRRD